MARAFSFRSFVTHDMLNGNGRERNLFFYFLGLNGKGPQEERKNMFGDLLYLYLYLYHAIMTSWRTNMFCILYIYFLMNKSSLSNSQVKFEACSFLSTLL